MSSAAPPTAPLSRPSFGRGLDRAGLHPAGLTREVFAANEGTNVQRGFGFGPPIAVRGHSGVP